MEEEEEEEGDHRFPLHLSTSLNRNNHTALIEATSIEKAYREEALSVFEDTRPRTR